MTPIQIDDLILLASIHAFAGIILAAIGWFLLGRNLWRTLAIALVLIWAWSLIAMIDFASGDTGFLSWFLDPSAEKNLVAMVNSALLLMVAVAAFFLFWQSFQQSPRWHGLYWFLLCFLFAFLAADEYYSLHESIVFWRAGYLGLGGLTALLSLVVIVTSTGEIRKMITLFLLGLGVMGVSGVVLDAFSAQNLLDIGPLKLTFLTCRSTFIGIRCSDFNNTEEMFELMGATMMVFGLWGVLRLQGISKNAGQRLVAAGGFWIAIVCISLWVLPSINVYFSQRAKADYGDLSLLAYSLSENTIEAGGSLDVKLYVRANQFLNKEYSFSVHLYTQIDAQSISQDDMSYGDFAYPTRGWLPFAAAVMDFHLDLPADLPTNESYQLVLIVWHERLDNVVSVLSSDLRSLDDGKILILDGIAAPSSDTPAAPDTPIYEFESGIYLMGYDLPESAKLGETLLVPFWWRSISSQNLEMRQFLHWFHEDTGEYILFDQTPFAGRFPTQDWPAGLLARDAWEINLPSDMPVGNYRLQTGLFRLDNQERLAVMTAQNQPVQDNSIVLGYVMVTE